MVVIRQAAACLKRCTKNGDLPKSPLLQQAVYGAIGRHDLKFGNRYRFASRVTAATRMPALLTD